jgi:hypothetical protein
MTAISDKPQPEATPAAASGEQPSLWLYITLLVFAVGLICLAFRMQVRADWPSLFLNLAAGLVGSVVILVFVDRRLRSQELASLRRLPTRTTQGLASLLFPTVRIGRRYGQSLLLTLEPLIAGKVELKQFAALEREVCKGFVLLAGPGEGKTTWTQMVAASLIRQYLRGLPVGRIPIIFTLARWLPDRNLDQALYEIFSSYSHCRRWIFERLLKSGKVAVLLDGYDELQNPVSLFETEIERLRTQFPAVAWTITSRIHVPPPEAFGEASTLSLPTEKELAAIQRLKQR